MVVAVPMLEGTWVNLHTICVEYEWKPKPLFVYRRKEKSKHDVANANTGTTTSNVFEVLSSMENEEDANSGETTFKKDDATSVETSPPSNEKIVNQEDEDQQKDK